MTRLTEKIVLGILALFMLVYVGYQVYLSLYGSIKTEIALEYSISRSIPVKGIAVRAETVIDGNYSGTEGYIYQDGTRVTVGENVAEYYASDKVDKDLRRMRELEDEIKMLDNAQNTSLNNFTSTENLNRNIKEQLSHLAMISSNSRVNNYAVVKNKLTDLLARKQIATGLETSYSSRISMLNQELATYKSASDQNSVVQVTAPVSGYFCKSVDGYENVLNTKLVDELNVTDLANLIESDSVLIPAKAVGKIITSQNWKFVAVSPKATLEFVTPGQDVIINFESENKKVPAVVTDIKQNKDYDNAVIVLNCDQVSSELIGIRHADAVINFNQYSGVRVNMSDIRFQGENRGVYIFESNTIRFKLIDPIYEEQGFVLSRTIPPDAGDSEYVKLFDSIVTKGTDLYDGKVIT